MLNPSIWIGANKRLAMTVAALDSGQPVPPKKKKGEKKEKVISCSLSPWQRGKRTNMLFQLSYVPKGLT